MSLPVEVTNNDGWFYDSGDWFEPWKQGSVLESEVSITEEANSPETMPTHPEPQHGTPELWNTYGRKWPLLYSRLFNPNPLEMNFETETQYPDLFDETEYRTFSEVAVDSGKFDNDGFLKPPAEWP